MAQEAFYDQSEEDAEVLDPELEEEDREEDEEDGEGEGEPKPAAKAVDWEKRAHDKEGAAAKERSRRRAAEKELSDMRSRLEALETSGQGDSDELLDLIASLRDDDDEPITDLAQIKRALKTFADRQKAEVAETRTQTKQVREIENLASTMRGAEADFVADHPDYFDAAKHYRDARTEELTDLGYAGQALTKKLAEDLFGVVSQAVASGRDPAEVVYGLAKRRGFQAGAAAVGKKLQQLQTGSKAATRPAGGRVGGGTDQLGWGDVAKLKGAARDKAFAALRSKEMGRR